MLRLLTKLTIYLLRSKKITGEQRAKVMSVLLDNIGVLPYKKILTYDERGNVAINGKLLDIDQLVAFKESVDALKNNYARQVFNQQRKYMAIEMGVHQGLNTEQIVFSKACLWEIQQEEKLIEDVFA